VARNTRRSAASNPREELIQLAIDLDLTALADSLPSLIDRAEKDSPSFTEFALALFRTEANARKTRRLERSLKRSHLGFVEGLDGFDFAARPNLDPRVVRELLNCRFVEEHRNVLCLGRPGLGKTRVAGSTLNLVSGTTYGLALLPAPPGTEGARRATGVPGRARVRGGRDGCFRFRARGGWWREFGMGTWAERLDTYRYHQVMPRMGRPPLKHPRCVFR
jgi:hypothetical protein